MKFTVDINSENDAMSIREIVRMLNVLCDRLKLMGAKQTGLEGKVMDINGNSCGNFLFEK